MNSFQSPGGGASREDVLLFRFIKLFQSVKQISEILVELFVNTVLFATSLLAWVFQFNSYLVSLFRTVVRVAARVSDLVTLQQKIYILVTIVILYLLVYLGNKVYNLLKIWRERYHMKWSILINHLLFVLSPYLIFIFTIYLPLCILVPKFYFETVLVRIWILWIPMAKAIISVYDSLLGGGYPPDSQLGQVISLVDKYNNTDLVLRFLEAVSSRVGGRYHRPPQRTSEDSDSLTLLSPKSSMARQVMQIKTVQCWVDYFSLWLIYFFLRSYILGNGFKYVSSIAINYLKVMNILILNTLNSVSGSNSKLIILTNRYRLISKPLKLFRLVLKPPACILKYILILTINMNWKYLLASVLVLNILIQIKLIRDSDGCFSIIFKNMGINVGIDLTDRSQGRLSCRGGDQEEEEDGEDGDGGGGEDEGQDRDYIRGDGDCSQEEGDLTDTDRADEEGCKVRCPQRRRLSSSSAGKSLLVYEYPSLSTPLRNYIILIIDWISSSLFGISLFSQLYGRGETSSASNTLSQLNPRSATKSLPSITRGLEDGARRRKSRASVKPELLHSNTMPQLSLDSSRASPGLGEEGERRASGQLGVIMSLLDNNLIMSWLPEGWRGSCLYVVENMTSKSNRLRYWILVAIILIGQVPQWVILLFPSFIVNFIGCMVFGYLYPLIISLRTTSYIGDSYYSLSSKTNEKLQACAIYLILFNLLNEAVSVNSPRLAGIATWIPFKIHAYYLAILLIQLASSIVPIFSKQVKLKAS